MSAEGLNVFLLLIIWTTVIIDVYLCRLEPPIVVKFQVDLYLPIEEPFVHG
jgi:hypothetical protein